MRLRLDRITIECSYAKRLAAFWAAATGYHPSTVTEAGIAALEPVAGNGPKLFFVTVPEPLRLARQLTLGLETEDLDEEVRILEGLGAATVQEITYQDRRTFIMRDPEGNEFRVMAATQDGAKP